jgi:hypothetical protein
MERERFSETEAAFPANTNFQNIPQHLVLLSNTAYLVWLFCFDRIYGISRMFLPSSLSGRKR